MIVAIFYRSSVLAQITTAVDTNGNFSCGPVFKRRCGWELVSLMSLIMAEGNVM